MKKRKVLAIVACTVFLIAFTLSSAYCEQKCEAVYGKGPVKFSLATGSPGELGLLKVISETFCKGKNMSMCWVKAGSGASLKLLSNKAVDVIMVHAPAAEKKAVTEGWAIKRTLIGSNEFYIVGPVDDPAGISSAKTAAEAYGLIAKAQAKFFSRGDNSGTHKKELFIWKQAGIEPSGGWYIVTKDFMSATLSRANSEKGYFMTDSSTWVSDRKNVADLKILFRGDKVLINTYHALCQPAGATPGASIAAEFIDFVASGKGQSLIGDYGKKEYGEGLYNDAAYAKQYE
ncbi:MAG: substrate-binding domain-containing protein [Deltaproteobacteria bacterium]|nr:substrate-binding domain-containing protein [Deltaproteobacteria bacterium]